MEIWFVLPIKSLVSLLFYQGKLHHITSLIVWNAVGEEGEERHLENNIE